MRKWGESDYYRFIRCNENPSDGDAVAITSSAVKKALQSCTTDRQKTDNTRTEETEHGNTQAVLIFCLPYRTFVIVFCQRFIIFGRKRSVKIP